MNVANCVDCAILVVGSRKICGFCSEERAQASIRAMIPRLEDWLQESEDTEVDISVDLSGFGYSKTE